MQLRMHQKGFVGLAPPGPAGELTIDSLAGSEEPQYRKGHEDKGGRETEEREREEEKGRNRKEKWNEIPFHTCRF